MDGIAANFESRCTHSSFQVAGLVRQPGLVLCVIVTQTIVHNAYQNMLNGVTTYLWSTFHNVDTECESHSTLHVRYRLCFSVADCRSVFGRVVGGLDVLTAMERTPTDKDDHPLSEIKVTGG